MQKSFTSEKQIEQYNVEFMKKIYNGALWLVTIKEDKLT